MPVVEHTELFKRAIGEYTDVVEKEMYTFNDSGGDSLTLRPEATAGSCAPASPTACCAVRASSCGAAGPMFRHERPQKGRYRQFNQVDVEAIGFAGPRRRRRADRADRAPVERSGLTRVSCRSIRSAQPEARRAYRERTQEYFRGHEAALDGDSRRRLEGNPLRILDSKNPRDAGARSRARRC